LTAGALDIPKTRLMGARFAKKRLASVAMNTTDDTDKLMRDQYRASS